MLHQADREERLGINRRQEVAKHNFIISLQKVNTQRLGPCPKWI